MFERLLASERLEPRLTPARLAAYAIAVLVYALTIGLFVGGIALAVFAAPNVFALIAAVVMVGAAFLMRPRLGKVPEENTVLRTESPALYRLVDEVAEALETPTVDLIVIDHDYNASWAVLGLRRQRVLTLGLPLLCALEPQERVALVAHELAHGRNGDSSRGLVVGTAVGGLAELYYLIAPESGDVPREWELGAFERIVNAFFYVLSRPVYGLLMLELHLLLRDAQRAEFLADALAARVAGTAAEISSHEKLFLDSTFRSVIQSAAHDRGRSDPFAEFEARVASVPERERKRRRRVARLEGARLSSTHPPSAQRIQLLEGRPPIEPQVVLDATASGAIDLELNVRRDALQRTLIEEYRDSLYYG